jgi:hypothetical protein
LTIRDTVILLYRVFFNFSLNTATSSSRKPVFTGHLVTATVFGDTIKWTQLVQNIYVPETFPASKVCSLNVIYICELVSANMKEACNTNSTNSTNAVQSCNPVSLKRVLTACRCSGVNHCSFRLTSDYPVAEDWGPGVVFIKYACINREFLPEPQTSELPG